MLFLVQQQTEGMTVITCFVVFYWKVLFYLILLRNELPLGSQRVVVCLQYFKKVFVELRTCLDYGAEE